MSFYPRLPDELKLMIWEEALDPEHGGVHHFKIGFDQPRTYQQTLTVHPQRGPKDDLSSWVDFWGLSVASRMSWDLVKKGHANRVLFWQKATSGETKKAAFTPDLPAFMEKTRQAESGKVNGVPNDKIPKPTRAFINGDKDIVCFTVVGSDFDLNWLNWANNHQRFRHLTHVAFNYLSPAHRPDSWITAPFQCICGSNCVSSYNTFCPSAITRFLRIFQNLRTFSFIIPIAANRLPRPTAEPLPRGAKRNREGQVIKRTGLELVTETMDKFKALAQKKGLSVFQDRQRTYYEVDCSSMCLLKDYERYQHTMKRVERFHKNLCLYDSDPQTHWYSPRANWSGVQFKFLVCRGR